MRMAKKYYTALWPYYISTLLVACLLLFGMSVVHAEITGTTDKIYGHAPSVSGEISVLLPDGQTRLLNEQKLNQQLAPDMFTLSPETDGLNYHDDDGDEMSALVLKNPHLQWLDDSGMPLTEQQLAQPLATTFSEKELLLVASADINVSSASGLPKSNTVRLQNQYRVKVTAMELQELLMIRDGMPADGKQTNQLLAKVINPNNGEPIAGQSVIFNVSGGQITSPLMTDEYGSITASFSNLKAGQTRVTARFNEQERQLWASFIADRSTATILFNTTHNYVIANGKAENTVEVKVTDSQANVLANEPVEFEVSNGVTLVAPPQTDANGELIVKLTSTRAGEITLKGRVPYSGSTDSTELEFKADGNKKLAKITIKALVNGAVADNKSINSIRATVTDTNNNPLSKREVTFTILSGSAVFDSTKQIITTNTLGQADIQLKSDKAGQVSVQASIGSDLDASYKAAFTDVMFSQTINGAGS